MPAITLYTYCKSTAAYRVRIALNYKNIPYQSIYVHLLKNGGENYQAEYLNVNPQAMVPTLKVDDHFITQSMAILGYLEETYPTPELLSGSPITRADIRSYALLIACDIHPLNNLRILQYLETKLGQDSTAKMTWYKHWIAEGFAALETRLTDNPLTGECCIGNKPSLADLCLIPQVYNANRYECDMSPYPIIQRINDHCLEIDAFKHAAPENQEDFDA
jgi:maleylpyruvate isomerase